MSDLPEKRTCLLKMDMRKSVLKSSLLAFFILYVAIASGNGSGVQKRAKPGRIKTVLVLGNSILKHSPKPDIGWYGNWGMAASVPDSDFVHLLIRDIHRRNPSVVVQYRNIADFERDFVSYPFSNLDSLRNPDMLIMKISENVSDSKAVDEDFIFWFDKLVNYLTPRKRAVKIIVDGFWEKKSVNRMLEEYALKNRLPFVSLYHLSADPTNMAVGKFEHTGVARHPSDKGMRMIEQSIWETASHFFPK